MMRYLSLIFACLLLCLRADAQTKLRLNSNDILDSGFWTTPNLNALLLGIQAIPDLGNVTSDKLTISVASGTAPYFTARDLTGGVAGELMAVANVNGNVMAFQNKDDSAFSAVTFRAPSGAEHGAFGIGGNSVSSAFVAYKRNMYIEATDANGEGWSPSFVLNQETNYAGSRAFGNNIRLLLNSDDGFLTILPRGVGTNLNTASLEATSMWFFDPDSPIVTGGPQADFRGVDPNWSVVLRNGGNSANGNDYSCIAGTMASTGGHRFWLGGRTNTLGLELASDGAVLSTPLLMSSSPVITGVGSLTLRGNDDNFASILRDATGVGSSYYNFGDTLDNSGGHKFFTGGVKGSQTLKVEIANDRTAINNPIRMKPQTVPGSVAEGDFYEDSTNHVLTFYDGTAWRSLYPPVFFADGTDHVHSNSTSGITYTMGTLPANFLQAKHGYEVTARGTVSTTGTPTLTFVVGTGGGSGTSCVITYPSGLSANSAWVLHFNVLSQGITSGTATVTEGGEIMTQNGTAGIFSPFPMAIDGVAAATGALSISLTVIWGTASSSNVLHTEQIEVKTISP